MLDMSRDILYTIMMKKIISFSNIYQASHKILFATRYHSEVSESSDSRQGKLPALQEYFLDEQPEKPAGLEYN